MSPELGCKKKRITTEFDLVDGPVWRLVMVVPVVQLSNGNRSTGFKLMWWCGTTFWLLWECNHKRDTYELKSGILLMSGIFICSDNYSDLWGGNNDLPCAVFPESCLSWHVRSRRALLLQFVMMWLLTAFLFKKQVNELCCRAWGMSWSYKCWN